MINQNNKNNYKNNGKRTSRKFGSRGMCLGGAVLAVLCVFSSILCAHTAWAEGRLKPFLVVAAENTWGDLAAQVAGQNMTVRVVLASPVVDPHGYDPSPEDARNVADATLVVGNGAGYDAWLNRLVQAAKIPATRVVWASDWSGWHEGDNPHLWFDLGAVSNFVSRFASACQQVDPGHAKDYIDRAAKLLAVIGDVSVELQRLRAHVQMQKPHVAATESFFAPLADQLGLVMEEKAFQTAIMNGTEPAPSVVAQFETDIKEHRLQMIVYNQQVEQPLVTHLVTLARREGVPVLPLTETLPAGEHWQGWMLGIIHQIDLILASLP
ncbi:MAG: zinc ABC transporter substrate-binding protein [Acetobacter sp.]|nr:zinc ABC transporter substrate-binding protein [Acetobacter sp.]